jgi:hypothetical protein
MNSRGDPQRQGALAENSGETAKPPRGRPFRPGQSGNPGGRPKTNAELVEAARELTPMALHVWEKAMTDFLQGHGDAAQALKAAGDSMARAWGRPPEKVALQAVVGVQDRERAEADLIAWVKRLAGEGQDPTDTPSTQARVDGSDGLAAVGSDVVCPQR